MYRQFNHPGRYGFMSQFFILILSLIIISCGQETNSRKRIQIDSSEEKVNVIILGIENAQEIKSEAEKLGLEVSGEHVLVIKGRSQDIGSLEFSAGNEFDYIVDEPLNVGKPEAFTPDNAALYLAKKDFNIPEFWKTHPSADGRNVIVAVIDDGISPHQEGFIRTTTGERKFLAKGTQSTFTTFDLVETQDGFETIVDEKRSAFEALDLNADGKNEPWKIKVNPEGTRACLDINRNETFEDAECSGGFRATGEFVAAFDSRLVVMFDIDIEKKKIQVFQPEKGGDSHGEGVAAVLAGYRIGGLPGFDGVAPGAKIVDYDLSEVTDKSEEKEFTLSTFITALDWAGANGAEVANISYSLFFTSAKTQTFMSKALDEIVKKHNIVISFSAGNNGPGLGSLNRRSIYPPSVLVAGAYISKELDERVHGVTGIPDEGRVVYYSSRGPGLGIGPQLISPLSSLVNSSPDGGHRAFSGTSSASPALAGAATVLISAIKQEGLKVDAATVVNALKFSGKRLQNEPFIFQGYGLPQVDKALSIYKELISGKKPIDVRVTIDRDTQDGVSPRGIFLRTSETKGITSRRISLAHTLSTLAPSSQRVNLLTPVQISYSKGISGSSELWVSASASSLFIDIDPEAMLGDKLEAFGEISVRSSLDQSLLVIIPVTVVRDQNVLQKPSATFKLSSQEGLRLPFFVPPGVKGFRVRPEVLDGDEKTAIFSVFDPHHIRLVQVRGTSDIWIPVNESGFYQVGLVMGGGTARGLTLKVTVEPTDLKVRTRTTNSQAPAVTITNHMPQLSGILRLTPMPELIESVMISSKDISKGAVIAKDLPEGTYAIEFSASQAYDLAYIYPTCTIQQTNPNGTSKLTDGMTLTVPSAGASMTARCMPFDRGSVFEEVYEWQMRLLKTGKSVSVRMDINKDQTSTIKFPATNKGKYKVEVQDPFTGTSITLTEIDLI